ncbi:MAG TPA: HAMP domain-containing protein [Anaerolineales bacterium]|nr:HAMP domain-containing protein [Anaerolineales bacterium]
MRLRLTFSYILIVVIAVVSILLLFRIQTVNAVRSFVYRGGMAGLERTVVALENYYRRNGSWDGINDAFQKLAPKRGPEPGSPAMPRAIQHLQLADNDGRILLDTGNPQPTGRLGPVERNQAIELSVDSQRVGYLYPVGIAKVSHGAETNLLDRLTRAAITAALIASMVALLVAMLLSYRLLHPVHELTHAARKLASGDLTQRVTVRGNDELATLATTFNRMADSLQQAENRRRALTTDIAHELRTPLAVQRAHIEALEDGIYALSIENLAPIEAQNHLLTRLVDDLRTLALADSGQLELIRTPTDFGALIQKAVTGLEPRAADRQIKIDLSLEESSPPLNLDAQRIEQILNNLLDNALRHTPDSGTIHIQCTSDSGQICLTVRDNGPGIPKDALPHLFERFYRADKSRSRSEGGTGLGLSIARKLAQAHGGDLDAANHPGGGAVFTLSLPLQ